jgi:hypothetical protein
LTRKGKETGNRRLLVKDHDDDGYQIGIAPRTEFSVFEVPPVRYLSMRHQRGNAWKLPWEKPKAIFYKSGRSRGPWKIAAFADRIGLVCYQTYTAVWPTTELYDETMLAAILNGPVANAFVAVREGKTDVTIENVRKIPMPVFTPGQRQYITDLVQKYERQLSGSAQEATRTLLEIDAAVLEGYRMPPRIEHELLELFRGYEADRRTVHPFVEYMPQECDFYMPLSRAIEPNFGGLSAEELIERANRR